MLSRFQFFRHVHSRGGLLFSRQLSPVFFLEGCRSFSTMLLRARVCVAFASVLFSFFGFVSCCICSDFIFNILPFILFMISYWSFWCRSTFWMFVASIVSKRLVIFDRSSLCARHLLLLRRPVFSRWCVVALFVFLLVPTFPRCDNVLPSDLDALFCSVPVAVVVCLGVPCALC